MKIKKWATNPQRDPKLIAIITVPVIAAIALLILYTNGSASLKQHITAASATSTTQALSTAVTRDLLTLEVGQAQGFQQSYLSTSLRDLKANASNVTKLLNTLERGGNTLSGHSIQALTDSSQIQAAKQVWIKYEKTIKDYLQTASNMDASTEKLNTAIRASEAASPKIHHALAAVSQQLDNKVSNSMRYLKKLQMLGYACLAILFILSALYFTRKIRSAEKQTNEALKETDDILKTIKEGLFLVNKDLSIGQQHSSSLSSMLGEENIANQSLTDLLSSLVSKKDLDNAKGFMGLLFDKKKKEKLIQDLNPLDRVEMQLTSDAGNFDSRYLNFSFSRVYEGKDVQKVLVGVSDITSQVELERQVERENLQNEQQIELLTSILHADMGILNSFIRHANECTVKVNNILKHPSQEKAALKQKINAIFVEVHSLKGEASALNFDNFLEVIHDFEEKLKTLSVTPKLSGNDFLPLAVNLEKLISMTAQIENIIERLGGFAKVTNDSEKRVATQQEAALTTPVSTDDSLARYYQQFVSEIAKRHNKKVELKISGLSDLQNNSDLTDVAKDITIQLLRNAVVHGAETEATRIQLKKPAHTTIKLDYQSSENGNILSIHDDGQGLNYEKIRQKAIDSGVLSQIQVNNLSPKQLVSLIFSSGFSTAEHVDEDAGRGVGLDVIKARLNDINGRIQVKTTPGKNTHFIIQIPNTGGQNV